MEEKCFTEMRCYLFNFVAIFFPLGSSPLMLHIAKATVMAGKTEPRKESANGFRYILFPCYGVQFRNSYIPLSAFTCCAEPVLFCLVLFSSRLLLLLLPVIVVVILLMLLLCHVHSAIACPDRRIYVPHSHINSAMRIFKYNFTETISRTKNAPNGKYCTACRWLVAGFHVHLGYSSHSRS